MKPNLLVLVGLILGVLLFFCHSRAVCPQDTVDRGICDTMYVEIHPQDLFFDPPGPDFARFPIFITHDVTDPMVDSLAAFIFPLCYTHTNPSVYCSLSSYWNTGSFWGPGYARSIFRDLVIDGDTIHNWMHTLYEWNPNYVWNNIILNLDGTSHFWLMLITTGPENHLFGDESRALLATMTFKLQDSMNICIDTCLWPPTSHLAFARSDAQTYIPRHSLPVCQDFKICINSPPYFSICPINMTPHTNGHYVSTEFEAIDGSGCARLTSVQATFQGTGVENINVTYDVPPPSYMIHGHVEYDVVAHCQPGGNMTLTVESEFGAINTCNFAITLDNNLPPSLVVPDTMRALADYTAGFQVSANDPESDPVEITMNAFWFESDSLQAPNNPPSFTSGNPGLFTWGATETDTGAWVALFSATDTCNKADTAQLVILVGMPFCGDCTKDSLIDLSDLVYLITYLFKGGPPPDQLCRADVNCSGEIDLGDPVILISYLYKGGTAPCFACCAGGF
jgi:hypothetical protein